MEQVFPGVPKKMGVLRPCPMADSDIRPTEFFPSIMWVTTRNVVAITQWCGFPMGCVKKIVVMGPWPLGGRGIIELPKSFLFSTWITMPDLDAVSQMVPL